MEVLHAPHVELSFDADVALSEGVDVEIEVFCGFDRESLEAIDSARKAAELLRSYGVEAIVVPRMVRWDFSAVTDFQSPTTPTVVVNGVVVSEGRALTPEELVDYALAFAGLQGEGLSLPAVPASYKRDGLISSAEHV